MKFANLLTGAEIRVHLSAGALIACEIKRGWGTGEVVRKASFEFEAGERAAAMDALALWIDEAAAARRSIFWIVGPTDAQYFMLPWSPAWLDRTLRDSYARAHFEHFFERDASLSTFCFADPSADSGQLVSCISNTLHKELVAHADGARCELGGIKPSIPAVWDQFRDVLETEDGTLCVVDGDQQAIVRHHKKHIENVVVKPFSKAGTPTVPRQGVLRLFTNSRTRGPTAKSTASLKLPTQRGYVDAQDSVYSFALCGAL
ncbi:MAG: hypothetical protein JWQ73_1633 [Variovorax sp.]|jgi:hypothetical protein|nr:hypothetical protein [Variovorax sp.]